MSSPSALGRALPALKLTAHDPNLLQVFTTPPSYMSRGDFGFKAPFQPALNAARNHRQGELRFVQVKSQDSNTGVGFQWKEREGEVILLKRWGETNTSIRRAESKRAIQVLQSEEERKSYQPLPHSRFDRSSRRSLPTKNPSTQPADLPLASASPIQTTSSMPNYHLYSERRFERLLQFIRNNRQAYKDARVLQRALDQRSAKYFAALRKYQELKAESEHASAAGGGMPSLPPRPKVEDFSVEDELEAIRNPVTIAEADEVELDPSDMYNLARSTHNYHLSKYVDGLFSKMTLDDPNSKVMPRHVIDAAPREQAALAYSSRRLHDLGGLQYAQPDEIFANVLSAPLPGRVLALADTNRLRRSVGNSFNSRYAVAVGSQVHAIRHSRAGGNQLMPFDRTRKQPGQGVVMVRFDYEVNLRPVQLRLDKMLKQKRFGSGTEGAWSQDMQHLGLGYISAEVRGTLRDAVTFKERVSAVGEQAARAESIPGSRGWVGKVDDTMAAWSKIRFRNPVGGRYADRFAFGGEDGAYRSPITDRREGSARLGAGARFSIAPGAGGERREDGRIKFDRDGFRRPGLDGSRNQQTKQQPQRKQSVTDLLFGKDSQ